MCIYEEATEASWGETCMNQDNKNYTNDLVEKNIVAVSVCWHKPLSIKYT